ncbi:MAG: hypothetical protein KC729_00170 [Candidatus Eisenbacteria bacterium]|uniref:Uncharacterized protein n=1 Tax=Eiseniibacteriota bacterium TaxID=2212470 RepID=A0A956LXH6_UNCEI|nr:hypothetical protein [Candidatus Eisenbacteria bacterium]
MSFDRHHFYGFVSHVLTQHQLWSPAAVNLVLGTCAQESHFGEYRRQLGGGPARGVYQEEPATFAWLRRKYGRRFPLIADRSFGEIEHDDYLATLHARLRYLVVPEPLPDPNDVEALGRYWKQHYNTEAGKGTVDEFVRNYRQFVEPEGVIA